jgi:hypothetical protein
MNYLIFPIVVVLNFIFAVQAHAQSCTGTDSITFRVNRFMGYGEAANTIRPLIQAIRLPQNISSEGVISRRGIKVGRYLFVYREYQGQGKWERYRQNDQGGYNPFVSDQNSIRVTTDESIFVKKEDGRELSIRRNSSDESLQAEIRVRVSEDKIEVIDRLRSPAQVLAQANFGASTVSEVNQIDVNLNSKQVRLAQINCAHTPEDGPAHVRRPREPYSEPHRSNGVN